MKAAKVFLLGGLMLAAQAHAQVAIEQPWARATPPGAKVAGGYMTIRNAANAPERLVGASSPAAARVELHVHVQRGEVMEMREVQGYDVPANGRFDLKPGGAHLMFVDIKQPLKEGDRIPVTLKFSRAGDVKVEFRVARLGARSPHGR